VLATPEFTPMITPKTHSYLLLIIEGKKLWKKILKMVLYGNSKANHEMIRNNEEAYYVMTEQ
jgi:hypothetical protein